MTAIYHLPYLLYGIRAHIIELDLITIYIYTVHALKMQHPEDMPNESNINKTITPQLRGQPRVWREPSF